MLEKDWRDTTNAQNKASMYSATDALSITPPKSAHNILRDISFLENGSEVLLLNDPLLPSQLDVHCVIEDTLAPLPHYLRLGYTIAIEPFNVSAGKCVVIQDARGVRICIFEKMLASSMRSGVAD